MKLTKITSRIRNDIWGELTCEFCDNVDKMEGGYDDYNYFNNVIPSRKCSKCGKTTKGERL